MPEPNDPRATTPATGEDTSEKEAVQIEEEEGLKDYWEDVTGPRPETIEQRLIKEFGQVHPGALTIANNRGEPIVQIEPNGHVRYGKGYTPDDAAEMFWTTMALKRVGMEQRLQHFAIMEATLVRLGRATLNYQQRLMASEAPGASHHERELADRARMNLNSLVANLTDYAAGLARRPIAAPEQAQGDVLRQTPAQVAANRRGDGRQGDPHCPTCRGEGTILGDCSDSPNVWFDECPTCRPNPNCPECHGRGQIDNERFDLDGQPMDVEPLERWVMPCPACRPGHGSVDPVH